MRFDDSLDTVLTADMSGPAAIEWTWRQVVDLIGRGRVSARPDAIARLRNIRDKVPYAARLASARGLERAAPPAVLVGLFSDQDVALAAPVVGSARLTGDEWVALLPHMRPATRGILRLRRDLSPDVMAALAAFGSTDFVLEDGDRTTVAPVADRKGTPDVVPSEPDSPEPDSSEPDSSMAVGAAARDLPAVAQGLGSPAAGPATRPAKSDDFEIAALVARIEAHRRTAAERAPATMPAPAAPADRFRFETDARGLIRWVDGIDRSPLIGLSLTAGRDGGPVSVDGAAAGALARRARFHDARLEVGGASVAAGSWRISGMPVFDRVSGRFTGYRGTARRPRIDEAPHLRATVTGDALRQLVHELRTPTNAISGFAEMIEHQLLGPVAPAYRQQAAAIRGQTVGLLDAIDDLDTAARIETRRLELRAEDVELAPMLGRIVDDLAPLAALRGTELTVDVGAGAAATGDPRALERLLSRFLTAVLASTTDEAAIHGVVVSDDDGVALTVTRPAAFVADEGALFGGDGEVETAGAGGPLLGAGFAFRLARRLATELGGGIKVASASLTLRLPNAVDRTMEQATI